MSDTRPEDDEFAAQFRSAFEPQARRVITDEIKRSNRKVIITLAVTYAILCACSIAATIVWALTR